jgi:hypothetical protein
MMRHLEGILTALAIVSLAACATPQKTAKRSAGLDSDGCAKAKLVTLGPAGGVITHGALTLSAKTGDLKEKVALEVATCPGSKPKLLKTIAAAPIPALPSTRIRFADKKAHGKLPVADGRALRYCVDTSKLAPETAAAMLIAHDDKVAAPHPDAMQADATDPAGKQCVGLAHLSWWHHFKKKVEHKAHKLKKKAKHLAHKAKKVAKKEVHKAKKAVKKEVKKLLNVCNDCKAGVSLIAGALTCGNAWAKTKMTAECIVRLDAEFPGLLEFTPAVCGGITAAVSHLCSTLVAGSKIGKLEKKLELLVCKKVHACKK